MLSLFADPTLMYNTLAHRYSRALDKIMAALPDALRPRCPMEAKYERCTVHLDGRPQTVYVDPHDDVVGQPFRRGAHWEAWLHGYFRQYANASEVAVDVGANMGAHTIVLARLFREVHSFEMQKRVMRLLRENVAANAYGNSRVRLHHTALGRTEAARGHYCSGSGNIGGVGASRRQNVPRRSGCYALRFTTLDRALANVGGRIALIKADVEGFEEDVLLGGRGLIARHRPVVLFESYALPRNLTSMFARLDYDVRQIRYPEDYIALPRGPPRRTTAGS